jgi:penicillin-binding protein 2
VNLPGERDERNLSSARLLRDDAKFAAGKIAFFQYVMVAIFLFLIAGFWDLQIRNPQVYQERALQNSIKSIPVLAPRGKILDRDGRVIVDNHSSFSVLLSRDTLKMEHLKQIADGLNLEYEPLVARVKRFQRRGSPEYEPIIIKEELSPAELAFVESHKDADTFPEMEIIRAQRRLYPKDGMAAHAVGYVGEVSEAELNLPEFAKFHQGDVIGKDGIERQYNDVLMGVDGQRRVEVDSFGHERAVLEDKEAIPGKDLQVTLDLDLQAVAELVMEDRKGAVVALDPRTGEVLAMVSRPAFDPNLFAGRIRPKDWKLLQDNPDKPLFNRAIQAQYAPGSTFKPIMSIAGLETGLLTDDFRVSCPGGATFYGHYFQCDLKRGHGTLDLHRAIVMSCDVFFYTVGNKLGIDTIAKYGEMAGLGHRTGIDLPHESEGIMPSTRWRSRVYRQKWYAGETISVAIGQGYTVVTPIQIVTALGGLAMGGVWNTPHLVRDANVPVARRAELNLDHIQKVISGMYGVVNEGGTGARAQIAGLDVFGKTGTAQVASNDAAKVNRSLKDNAWFVGLAPRQAPEIAVVALFEGGEHSWLAAPIVRDVIKAYFDKKVRLGQFRYAIYTPPKLLAPPLSLVTPSQIAKPGGN